MALADCEAIFRAQEANKRMRDKAAPTLAESTKSRGSSASMTKGDCALRDGATTNSAGSALPSDLSANTSRAAILMPSPSPSTFTAGI